MAEWQDEMVSLDVCFALFFLCIHLGSAAETEFVMPCFLVPECDVKKRPAERRFDSRLSLNINCERLLSTVVSRFLNDRAVSLSRVNESNWRLVGVVVVNNLKSIKAVRVSSYSGERNLMVVCRSFGFLDVVIGNRFFNYCYCRNWIFFFVLLFLVLLFFVVIPRELCIRKLRKSSKKKSK